MSIKTENHSISDIGILIPFGDIFNVEILGTYVIQILEF